LPTLPAKNASGVAALPSFARRCIAIALLSLAQRWQRKRRHITVASQLLMQRWQHSCPAVFASTRITAALTTKTTVTKEAVMPISPAGKRGSTTNPSATTTTTTT
jgi:hypothetical protein